MIPNARSVLSLNYVNSIGAFSRPRAEPEKTNSHYEDFALLCVNISGELASGIWRSVPVEDFVSP
jgi:hypothetical protein